MKSRSALNDSSKTIKSRTGSSRRKARAAMQVSFDNLATWADLLRYSCTYSMRHPRNFRSSQKASRLLTFDRKNSANLLFCTFRILQANSGARLSHRAPNSPWSLSLDSCVICVSRALFTISTSAGSIVLSNASPRCSSPLSGAALCLASATSDLNRRAVVRLGQ